MIIDDIEGVTISVPVMSFINNGIVETNPIEINYKNLILDYYNNFYYGIKLLGGKIAVEKLQLNYRLTSLPRSNKYLDNPPTVIQSDLDKIVNILNFEQDYNRSTGYAVELEIKNNNYLINKLNFYNFGLNNNELDMITPHLTVNSVDIPSVLDTLSFQLYKPINFNPLSNNYFTIFGSFIFKGKLEVQGIK